MKLNIHKNMTQVNWIKQTIVWVFAVKSFEKARRWQLYIHSFIVLVLTERELFCLALGVFIFVGWSDTERIRAVFRYQVKELTAQWELPWLCHWRNLTFALYCLVYNVLKKPGPKLQFWDCRVICLSCLFLLLVSYHLNRLQGVYNDRWSLM